MKCHILYFTDNGIFVWGPVFPKHVSLNGYGMDGTQFSPAHTVWGRCRNIDLDI
jgi:hypothetical protein